MSGCAGVPACFFTGCAVVSPAVNTGYAGAPYTNNKVATNYNPYSNYKAYSNYNNNNI